MKTKNIRILEKVKNMQTLGILQYYRQALADRSGAVSIGLISAECIAIMVLVVILTLIPLVASSVQDNLPAINSTSAWASAQNAGADMWGQVSPLITVSVIVAIIGLVLKVIYDLKHRD